MKYIIKPRAARKIYAFYGNVAKKYCHSYDQADYKRNVRGALMAIYGIEKTLLRRKPTIQRWRGYYMAKTDKWYFAYTIDDGVITIVDACHTKNMHE